MEKLSNFLYQLLFWGKNMTSDNVIASEKTSLKDAVEIAKKGTHCGMCRTGHRVVWKL